MPAQYGGALDVGADPATITRRVTATEAERARHPGHQTAATRTDCCTQIALFGVALAKPEQINTGAHSDGSKRVLPGGGSITYCDGPWLCDGRSPRESLGLGLGLQFGLQFTSVRPSSLEYAHAV